MSFWGQNFSLLQRLWLHRPAFLGEVQISVLAVWNLIAPTSLIPMLFVGYKNWFPLTHPSQLVFSALMLGLHLNMPQETFLWDTEEKMSLWTCESGCKMCVVGLDPNGWADSRRDDGPSVVQCFCPSGVSWHFGGIKQALDCILVGEGTNCCTWEHVCTGDREFVDKRETLSNGCKQSRGWQLQCNLLQSPPDCFTAAGNHRAAVL